MIPLVDVKAAYLRHRAAIDAAVQDVLESTAFIQGPQLRAFEEAYAAYCGTKHAIGVGSGTAALHLALAAAGVGAGDVVAVPAHTFIATVEPVSWLGARPRFVEIDPETGAMDPVALKGAIDGVSAVLPVDIHGRPADLEQIAAVAADAGVPLIEDAAQAHGAEVVRADGTVVRAGGYGLAGCFSFYPGKNLGAFGDAGAITTNDDAFAATVRRLRDHGRTSKYEHEIIGYAHRMDTLQAAVLSVKLSTLDADNRRRAALMARYEEELTGVGDLWFPPATPDRRSVFHHALVRTSRRDSLLSFLKERGIGAGVHYPIPVHLQPAYAFLGYRRGDLPSTEAWADECLSLPLYPELSDAQLAGVVDAVRAFF
ncbi:DegT/DnrJ/EryC1/StrS family aminotransferase [Phytohabitans rumicis]|uniref:Glutamine--scyllo-inositol aminotransferase n=1 Tax=Phytohabitans rumicis TaxID=1076125 RepID=A0A6V8LBP1_9ACTN|nr:DegT/DnrJ/EryC1/StrS family aminotransferase [Phytohabitans rumicis]GFJ94633.1 glutamine--scyllo-inositol aminotransferase [Phytohabitans rumicis]